jgi:hypothetical protein
VRQCAECEIEPCLLPVSALYRGEHRQVVRRKLREYVGHGLAGAAIGREQDDLDARMPDQQPQQFRPGIARGTEDADFCFRSHD